MKILKKMWVVKLRKEDFKEKIKNLSIWKKGDQRAPHKPLLILLFFKKLLDGEPRLRKYQDVRNELKSLLNEFGPPRRAYQPKYPFLRLTNDSIWELTGKTWIDPKRDWGEKELIKNEISGGFDKATFQLLKKDPPLVKETAELLLEDNFPNSIHEDILSAVGLDFGVSMDSKRRIKKTRDPKFREKILRAYEFSCAVCGFNVRLEHTLIGVEAAHIKWYQAGGPDEINNGVALCTLHHKLFDRGVFSLEWDLVFKVAENAHGGVGFDEWLMQFHGKKIRSPQNPHYMPEKDFINWHLKEVFKGPARYSV